MSIDADIEYIDLPSYIRHGVESAVAEMFADGNALGEWTLAGYVGDTRAGWLAEVDAAGAVVAGYAWFGSRRDAAEWLSMLARASRLSATPLMLLSLDDGAGETLQ